MKAKLITYSRLISKGGYENAKIEIQLEVEEGEKASDVFNAAKQFVEKRIFVERQTEYSIDWAKRILENRRQNTIEDIEKAENVLDSIDLSKDDLPF